jgi:ferrous iron transport protein A
MSNFVKSAHIIPLGHGHKGLKGIVTSVGGDNSVNFQSDDPFSQELERRLLEIGFVEGAEVEILHEGFIGKDPIAVRVDDMSVALRRREANAIMIRPLKA